MNREVLARYSDVRGIRIEAVMARAESRRRAQLQHWPSTSGKETWHFPGFTPSTRA